MIILRDGNVGRTGIATTKVYNISPYTYVNVEVANLYVYNTYTTPAIRIHRGKEFYNAGAGSSFNEISKIDLRSGATYNQVFSLNISAFKISDYITVSVQAYVSNHSGKATGNVYRVWLS